MKWLEVILAPFHAGARGRIKMRKSDPHWPVSPIWLHCASSGEWEQMRPVAEALHAWRPDIPLLLSFYSPSGFYSPGTKFPAQAVVGFPVDTPAAAADFLNKAQPRMALFIKAEIWLNMWEALQDREIPVVLVAARWGKSQFLEKSWAKPWRKVLEKAAFISTQDEATLIWCKTFLSRSIHVSCDGDPRVERVKSIASGSWENEPNWPLPNEIAIAGSIWPEDVPTLEALMDVNLSITWVVAPHQLDASFLLQLERRWAGRIQRWSELEKGAAWSSPQVILMDVLGQLSKCYRWGKIAYVGGGFGKQVHNVLEPAAYGLPALFGPHFQRSREAATFVRLGTAFSGIHPKDFLPVYVRWTQDKAHLNDTKSLIYKWFNSEPDTSKRLMAQLKVMLRFS